MTHTTNYRTLEYFYEVEQKLAVTFFEGTSQHHSKSRPFNFQMAAMPLVC